MTSTYPAMAIQILKNNVANFDELSPSEIDVYFNYSYDVKKAPKLTDEDKAVELIKRVIKDGGFILGCVDYDSDGLNSGAVIHKALKNKSDNYLVINNKRVHHNGFNPVFVSRIKEIHDEKPIDLILAADHGSNDNEAFIELKEYGIKHIIITDHHDISKDTPPDNVDVFINPQKAVGDPIGMCGCYVVFKILSGLYDDSEDLYNVLYKDCLPHVAIATVSDVMSLSIDYNRAVVRAGTQIMNNDTGLWDVLRNKLNIAGSYQYKDIAFMLSPFINTGNRVSKEGLFLRILIEEDLDMLSSLVDLGVEHNVRRKNIKKVMVNKALESLCNRVVGNTISIIVDNTIAINGIIASSLGENYNVPVVCFIMDRDNKTLSGSARANVDHVNVVEVFRSMAKIDPELFIKYGGHKGAGGCGIPFDKFDVFKRLFEDVVSKIEKPSEEPAGEYIIPINTKYLTPGIVDDINTCGPYGKDWVMPKLEGVFKIKGVYAMRGMAILTLLTPAGLVVKGTYFYKTDDSKDSVECEVLRDMIVTLIFEPQYYKRGNLINFTLMITNITSKPTA